MGIIDNFRNIEINGNIVHYNGNRISTWWGKTYFHYNSQDQKLHYENFSLVTRILRFLGEKMCPQNTRLAEKIQHVRQYTAQNFWSFLKDNKFVSTECPKKEFRKAIQTVLENTRQANKNYLSSLKNENCSDQTLISILMTYPINTLSLPVASYDLWRPKLIQYLIEKKQVDPGDWYGLLQKACQHKDLTFLNWCIDQKGIQLDAFQEKVNPLSIACERSDFASVKKFIEYGANVNLPNQDEKTPLCQIADKYSVNKADVAIARYLIDRKATNFTDALALACGKGKHLEYLHKEWAITQESHELIKLLVDNGANVTEGDPSSLHLITRYGTVELAEYLRERAKPSVFDATILHKAVESGREEMVKWALQYTPDIDAVNSRGWTPLHTAANDGFEKITELLLEKGADLKRDVQGQPSITASHIATELKYVRVAKIISDWAGKQETK